MDSESEKKEIQRLKDKLDELSKKIAPQQNTSNTTNDDVRRELQELKDKYTFLLESIVRLQSQGQRNFPIELSNTQEQKTEQVSLLGNLQVLHLLKESRATSRELAVTSLQLKKAFSLSKSERTLRNKLNYLELHNLVSSFGKKPKIYFITPSGMSFIEKHNKTAIFTAN